MIHFVYSGNPEDDSVFRAPSTKTNKLFRFFQTKGGVRFYQYNETWSGVEVEEDDIIIGHPHPEPNTMIKHLFSQKAKGKYLLFPYHSALPVTAQSVSQPVACNA